MKIIGVEPIHLRLPEVNERCDGSQETLIVRVHTDAGISGTGEVDSSALVAKAIIEAPLSHKLCRGLAECVLGQDPFEGVNIAASLHLLAALPNSHYFEYCVEQGALRQSLTKQRFPVIDGDIHVPEGSGLGVDLDERVVEKYRVG